MKTLRIIHDSSPENPFENNDYEFPIITTNKDYSNGDIQLYLSTYLRPAQIQRNQKKIFNLIESSKVEFDYDYPSSHYDSDERIDALSDLLTDWLDESMENKAEFCEAFNIKHYYGTSEGYSQSSWSKVFICWTPQFEKITSVKYKDVTIERMEGTFDLFGYWAWGDVFGFELTEDVIVCDCCNNTEENDIASCWGFYGDDHFKSGLAEHVRPYFEELNDTEFKEMIKDIEVEYSRY